MSSIRCRCGFYIEFHYTAQGRQPFNTTPVSIDRLGAQTGYLPTGRGTRLVPLHQAPAEIREQAKKAFIIHRCPKRPETPS